MSTNRSYPGRQGLPSFRGRVMVDISRGQIRTRAWPKGRGVPGSPYVRAMNSWLKSAVQLSKYMDPYFFSASIGLAKGTGLYPRDLVIQAMAGNLAYLVDVRGFEVVKRRYFLEPVMYQGARAQRTSNLSIGAGSVPAIAWQQPIIDTAGMFSLAEPTRLTPPAGVTRVNVACGCRLTGSSSGVLQMQIRRNGTDIIALHAGSATLTKAGSLITGPINVLPGDYFEAMIGSSVASTLVATPESWFACDILEAS